MISLYDTLSDRVETLVLRRPGEMSMYVCGPTVYDHPHLGHARSALTYDVLRRYLEWRGLKVHHVSNITDIDDKIIARARRENRTESQVAAEWERIYSETMTALGVLAPHDQPRATEWVDEMVRLVDCLIAADRAYLTDSGVYLRVREIPAYGDLVHRAHDELRLSAGSRVEVDTNKEDPLDFALWKAAKPGEPVWDAPFGPGRPGWHIECAAMSLSLLGEDFDLHGGGDDLVFPHHTNERAEALAAGHAFARHWMHNAMLNVDGAKMAKSSGNFRTVADLLDEHPLNGRALRLLVLQTHYRKTMEVNAELMAVARAATGRLDAMIRRAAALGIEIPDSSSNLGSRLAAGRMSPSAGRMTEVGELSVIDESAAIAVEMFTAAMDDDLGTPEAVAVIFGTLRQANRALDSGTRNAKDLVAAVVGLADALGLAAGTKRDGQQANDDAQDSRIEQMVAQRDAARRAKDWATADAIRDHLTKLGVTVEDTPTGPIWRRATP